MMKRIWTSLLCILMMLGLSVGCFAAEETLTDDKLSASHIVTAKYVFDYADLDCHTLFEDENDDGEYSGTTNSGLSIKVLSEQKGLTLVVHEITEDHDSEAVKWFKAQFKGLKNIAPLEIYFIDATGKRIDLPAGTEITLSNLKADQYITGLSAAGKKNRYANPVKDASITFRSNVAGDYYVICTPGDAAGQPQTGDDAALTLWIALMTLSAAGVVIVGRKLKVKN